MASVVVFFISMAMMNLMTSPVSKLKTTLSKTSDVDFSTVNTSSLQMETSPATHEESKTLVEPSEGLASWVDYIAALSGEASRTVEDVDTCRETSTREEDPRLRLFDEL
jgi:hypothetical protein